MEYQVLSPWADVDQETWTGLRPRVTDLNNKTIGLFAGFKRHWVLVLEEVERQLKERFPGAKFSHYQYPRNMEVIDKVVEIAEDDKYRPSFEKWLKGVDTVVSANGDAGSCSLHVAYLSSYIEKVGKPLAMLAHKDFVNIARAGAAVRGVPKLRIVPNPIGELSNLHSLEGVEKTILQPGISSVIDDIIAALTDPLTKDEEEIPSKQREKSGVVFKGNLEEVNRSFYKRGWAYGMPIIPPTEEAVREMLTGTDLPPDHVVAEVPPMLGKATVEKIAINAVMAGCLPTYMPVLIAAVQAITAHKEDRVIWLEGFSCSMLGFAPLLCVSGPIRRGLDIRSYMTPYYKANAAIGHALGLIIMNIGGTRPGLEDMAAFGHEGRLGMCICENEEMSPWEPLHVDYGLKKEDSAVTLFWPAARKNIFFFEATTSGALKALCDQLESLVFGSTGCILVMYPLVAKMFADEGWTRKDITNYLTEYARRSAAGTNVRWIRDNQHSPHGNRFLVPLDDTRSMRKFDSAKDLGIVVAGAYAAPGIVAYWGGVHGNIVNKKIELPKNWTKLVEKYKDIVPTYVPHWK
jgi:hypothetical protein